jgi:hypothetical protein
MSKFLRFENKSKFPDVGEDEVFYFDNAQNEAYIWDGKNYQLTDAPKTSNFVGPHPTKPPQK